MSAPLPPHAPVPRRPLLHWAMLLSLVVMFGSSFLWTKLAVTVLLPADVVVVRLALGTLVLATVALLLRRRWPRGWGQWRFVIAIAVFGNLFPFLLIAWGQQGVGSGVAGICMAVMPLVTLLLAHFLVAGERLTGARLAGFCVGFAGVVVLIGPTALLEFRGEGRALWSQIALFGGASCYAITAIIARHRPPADVLGFSTAVLAVSLLLAWGNGFAASGTPLPALAPLLQPDGAVAWPLAGALLGLGLLSSAVATLVFLKLIELAGPTFLSLINYLIPLWAVLLGMLVLGERPDWTALAALALVLGGIGLAERGRASGHRRPHDGT